MLSLYQHAVWQFHAVPRTRPWNGDVPRAAVRHPVLEGVVRTRIHIPHGSESQHLGLFAHWRARQGSSWGAGRCDRALISLRSLTAPEETRHSCEFLRLQVSLAENTNTPSHQLSQLESSLDVLGFHFWVTRQHGNKFWKSWFCNKMLPAKMLGNLKQHIRTSKTTKIWWPHDV